MRVTEKCDVYSFEVVALEIMMGRRTGELLESMSAPSNSSDNEELLLKDVLDQRLLPPTGSLSVAVMLVLVALFCTKASPELRPTMSSMAQQLSARTRSTSLSEPLRTLTIKGTSDSWI